MDGTQLSDHLAAFLVPDLRADDVVGHEVGRALDTVEGTRDRRRECLCGSRLREAGDGFDQHVAAREQRGGQRAAQTFLADDGVLENIVHTIEQPLGVGQLFVGQVVGHGLSLRARSDAISV